MIKQIKERMSECFRRIRIRTKLALIMLISAALSLTLFGILWGNAENVWNFLSQYPAFSWDKETEIQYLKETARNYDVPDSENDKEGIKAIQPYFAKRDKYTGIYIYEIEGKGLFRAGAGPEKWDEFLEGTVLSLIHKSIPEAIEGEDMTAEFRNGEFFVLLRSYHSLRLITPYLVCSVLSSIFLFLFLTLMFINRKINDILYLKDEILRMASGELTHPISACGEDEIGILSSEMDYMRTVLKENVQQAEERRKANQDLIAAMSHDLRTPLTILNGYLEVLKLKRIPPDMESEYLERCLQKTSDIKDMTDKMFEYTLVFEETETIKTSPIPLKTIQQILKENMDFLQLAGFLTESELAVCTGSIMGDEAIIKRIFSNLFSNILKYGDKKEPVKLRLCEEQKWVRVSLSNAVKQEQEQIESSRIGLKSVEKMIQLHEGEMEVKQEDGRYWVQIGVRPFCSPFSE